MFTNLKSDYNQIARNVIISAQLRCENSEIVVKEQTFRRILTEKFNAGVLPCANPADYDSDKALARCMQMVRKAVPAGRALHIGKGYYDITPLASDIAYELQRELCDLLTNYGQSVPDSQLERLDMLDVHRQSIPTFEVVKRVRKTA